MLAWRLGGFWLSCKAFIEMMLYVTLSWIQIAISLTIPDTCSLISSACCLAADRWESGVVENPANRSVIRPYQVRVAGSWPASCCPLQPCCCCCCCCCRPAALLPSPSCTRRRTDTGCTASWASWPSCWTYPRSGWWTARATSCSCLPEWLRVGWGTRQNETDHNAFFVLMSSLCIVVYPSSISHTLVILPGVW